MPIRVTYFGAEKEIEFTAYDCADLEFKLREYIAPLGEKLYVISPGRQPQESYFTNSLFNVQKFLEEVNDCEEVYITEFEAYDYKAALLFLGDIFNLTTPFLPEINLN